MPKKPSKIKPKHWHLGECDPKLRIGTKGVRWQDWFECCKVLAKKFKKAKMTPNTENGGEREPKRDY